MTRHGAPGPTALQMLLLAVICWMLAVPRGESLKGLQDTFRHPPGIQTLSRSLQRLTRALRVPRFIYVFCNTTEFAVLGCRTYKRCLPNNVWGYPEYCPVRRRVIILPGNATCVKDPTCIFF